MRESSKIASEGTITKVLDPVVTENGGGVRRETPDMSELQTQKSRRPETVATDQGNHRLDTKMERTKRAKRPKNKPKRPTLPPKRETMGEIPLLLTDPANPISPIALGNLVEGGGKEKARGKAKDIGIKTKVDGIHNKMIGMHRKAMIGKIHQRVVGTTISGVGMTDKMQFILFNSHQMQW